jgi:hypothetical protein
MKHWPKKTLKLFKRSFKKSHIATLREIRETKEMIRIYKEGRREHFGVAHTQLLDLFKIIMLFPVMVLPGSVVILTLLEMVARLFGATIFPKKQNFRL